MAALINQRLLKVCIEKFNFPTGEKRQKIDGIIKGWQTAFKDHDLSKAKETSLQGKFFSKFFCEILGYTMQDDGAEIWTLKQEAKTEVDGKEADGSIGYYSKDKEKTHCVIELKDAQCNLDAKQVSRENKQTPVEQAFQYLYKFADCDWVIVSNFRYTRLYHKSKGQTAYEEFDILNLHDEKEFKRFYYCLCCENLLDKFSNSPIDLLIKQSGEADIDITKAFYSEFKQVRKILFEHICKNNPNYDKKLLLEKTQKLLDRFIFIFFCEDTTGLLPHNTVENIYKMAQNSFSMSPCRIWEQFRGLFVAIDKGNSNVNPPINAYNGGLFAYDEILDSLIIQDEMFEHLRALARYDFESDLNVNILGHIFEQSLSDLEHIKNELDGISENKKNSKRKKDGIFYTPEYITHYIVEETIGKYLEENPEKLETIKILDPACGSGAFLNQAHEFLKQQHNIRVEERINAEKSRKRGGQEFVQVNLLKHINPMEIDRSILLNNLFGVDLNKESVEITKLALWLKTANSKCKLQNLDENVKCGNSLIDDETIAGDRAFKWENEFPEIFSKCLARGDRLENGEVHSETTRGEDYGFDVIIGNPPYVFTRGNMNNSEKKYFCKTYKNTQFKLNTYILFIEKSLNLLKNGGIIGFIMPNNWLTLEYSSDFRKYLLENDFKITIIQTPPNVFPEASVDTVILIIKKIPYTKIEIKKLENAGDRLISVNNKIEYLNNHNYIINFEQKSDKKINNLCKKIIETSTPLCDIAEVKNGIQAYTVGEGTPKQTKEMKEQRVYHRLTQVDESWIKYVEGIDVQRYFLDWSLYFVKYGKNLSRPRKSELFYNDRILVRQIPAKPPYSILAAYTNEHLINDNNSMIVKTLSEQENPSLYLLSILNSKLISYWFIKTFGKLQRGIFPQFKIKELQTFPICNASLEIKKNLSDKVQSLIQLNKTLVEEQRKAIKLFEIEYKPKNISKNLEHFYELGLNPFFEELEKQGVKLSLSQKEDLISWYKLKSKLLNGLKTQIETLDNEIDQEVYKIYGLTQDEIKIIEES